MSFVPYVDIKLILTADIMTIFCIVYCIVMCIIIYYATSVLVK